MFSKAPLRRFNDVKDTNPPLGSYDPKFMTDLAIAASIKGPLIVQPERSSSRSSSRSNSPGPVFPRSISFQRSRSTLVLDETPPTPKSRRNSSQPATPRLRPLTATVAFHAKKCKAFTDTATDPDYGIEKLSKAEAEVIKLSLQSQNDSLQSKLENLKEQFEESKKVNRQLEDQKKIHEQMVNELKKNDVKHSMDKEEWNATHKSLTDTIKTLQDSLERIQSVVDEYQEKYLPLAEEKDALQITISELNSEIELNKQTIKDLEEELNNLRIQITESETKCQLLIESNEKNYSLGEKRVAQAEKDLKDWKLREKELMETVHILEENCKELKEALDNGQILRNSMKAQLDNQVSVLENQNLKANAEIQELKEKIIQRESENLARIAQLKQQLEDSEDRAQKFSKRIKQINEVKQQNDKRQTDMMTIIGANVDPGVAPSLFVEDVSRSSSILSTATESILSDVDSTEVFTTNIKDALRRQIDEIRNTQQENQKRREVYTQKIEETTNWLSELQEENRKQKEEIVATLKMDFESSLTSGQQLKENDINANIVSDVDVDNQNDTSVPLPILTSLPKLKLGNSADAALIHSKSDASISKTRSNEFNVPERLKKELKSRSNGGMIFGGLCCASTLTDVQEESDAEEQ